MNILDLPLANFLGITASNRENAILEIQYTDACRNHLNLYHASVIYSLAEISSGALLMETFPTKVYTTTPLVRRSRIKYSAIPANDVLYSKGRLINQSKEIILDRLENTGKVSIDIQIDIFDVSDSLVFRGNFEWFVQANKPYETLNVSKSHSS